MTAQRLTREVLEYACGAHDLAGRLGQRLAFLARQQFAERLGTRHDGRADLVEQVGPYLGRGRGPCRERGARCLNRAVDLGGTAVREVRDDLTRVGRVDARQRCLDGRRLAGDEVSEVHRAATDRCGADVSSPRPARFDINAPIPSVHGAAALDVVTRLTSVPRRGEEIRTTSPVL